MTPRREEVEWSPPVVFSSEETAGKTGQVEGLHRCLKRSNWKRRCCNGEADVRWVFLPIRPVISIF